LITEYDIWTVPQAADNFEQPGDPQPCDPYTTLSGKGLARYQRRARLVSSPSP
jgi:hypothetical protein